MKQYVKAEHSPFILDVLVDEGRDGECRKGEVPPGDDWQDEVEDDAGDGKRPVIVAEARSPVGRLEECLQDTDQVHEQVAHQEEPDGVQRAHALYESKK